MRIIPKKIKVKKGGNSSATYYVYYDTAKPTKQNMTVLCV